MRALNPPIVNIVFPDLNVNYLGVSAPISSFMKALYSGVKDHNELIILGNEILFQLNKAHNISETHLKVSSETKHWAIYNHIFLEIRINFDMLSTHSPEFILEILFHEWAHHWQVQSRQIDLRGSKYMSYEEFDILIHNLKWQYKVNELLTMNNAGPMKWTPKYRRGPSWIQPNRY
jgi:hypothetical protein